LYKPAYGYEMRKRTASGLTGGKKEDVAVALLQSGSRRPPLPKLRRTIALKLIIEYGVSLAETARRLGLSTSGVAQISRRSERA
jgi:hypothetical protein